MEDHLGDLKQFIEIDVFYCSCGKSYVVGQRRFILKHIETCPEFKVRLHKEKEKDNNSNKNH